MYSCDHSPVHVRLENESVLTEFHQFTQENIIAPTGRRLFPYLKVLIDNLDPSSIYDIYLDFIQHARYEWIENEWMKINDPLLDTDSCSCEGVQQYQTYFHEASPNSGRFWMASPVSFARVKVTNLMQGLTSDLITLKPMHKYEPRIRIVQRQSSSQTNPLVHSQKTFPIASFIAVTTYQNTKITELKIRHNPIAQCFRAFNLKQERARAEVGE